MFMSQKPYKKKVHFPHGNHLYIFYNSSDSDKRGGYQMKVSKTMLLSTAAGLLLSLTATSVSAHYVNEEHHFKVTAHTETDPGRIWR